VIADRDRTKIGQIAPKDKQEQRQTIVETL